MIDEELAVTYKLMHTKWKKACITVEQQKKTTSAIHIEKEKLVSTITCFEEEVTVLNSKLEHMTKFVCMLNIGYDMLDKIL